MIQKPKLKTFLTVFPISDTTWGLRGGAEELWRIKLNDDRSMRAFSALLPYLNGRHQSDDILKKVSEQGVDTKLAQQLLQHLEKSLLIEETESSGLEPEEEERFRDQLTFFSRFTSEGGAKYQSLLRASRVGLIGDGSLSRSVLRHLGMSGFGEVVLLRDNSAPTRHEFDQDKTSTELQHTKLTLLPLDRNSIWTDDLTEQLPQVFIVPQEAHDPQLMEAMDVLSKSRNVAWMLLRTLDLQEGWVGPLFVPGDTASYLSLEARLRGNIQHFDEYQAFDAYLRDAEKPSASSGGLHAFLDLLSGIAVTEIIKYVTGIRVPHLAGRFLTINLLSWETEIHDVLRVPRLEQDPSTHFRLFPWKEVTFVHSSRRG